MRRSFDESFDNKNMITYHQEGSFTYSIISFLRFSNSEALYLEQALYVHVSNKNVQALCQKYQTYQIKLSQASMDFDSSDLLFLSVIKI